MSQAASCLKPAFPEPAVPVVFAANDRFVPYVAVCLQSLLEHTSRSRRYDVILLETDLSGENREVLTAMTAACPWVSLRFFDPTPLLEGCTLIAGGHISRETYFRFLIPDILPDYDKVLYLDCDLVLQDDPAKLFDTDLTGFLLAAAPDPEFSGHLHGADKAIQRYILRDLGMKNPEGYFQAGVLLLNTAEFRRSLPVETLLEETKQAFRYHDQDILNRCCEGRVQYLPMDWNLLTDCCHTRVSKVLIHAPEPVQRAYHAARRNPHILHYAGHRKPWHSEDEDFAAVFWQYADRTPYASRLREDLRRFRAQEAEQEQRYARSLRGRLARIAKQLLRR